MTRWHPDPPDPGLAAYLEARMITVLGIDPGGTAGFLLASWEPGALRCSWARAYQCDGDSASGLLTMLLTLADLALTGSGITAVQIEAFDDRPRQHGLHGTSPSRTSAQVSLLTAGCDGLGVPYFTRRASEVKNWSADARLSAAGLLDVTAGMPRHARDAGRHCLYCAVRNCGVPDPAGRRRSDVPG